MKHKALTIIGWYGVVAILTAYGLLAFDIIAAKSYPYLLLNLTGAGGLLLETIDKKDMQPAVLNAVWLVIAVIALVQLALT